MPVVLTSEMSRRSFLTASALGVAAFMGRGAFAADEMFHLALLSDTHIPGDRMNGNRGFNPWENLKAIVPDVVAAKPEGVIVNGDAARLTGQMDDYKEFTALLEPVTAEVPVYVGMGNHDDRKNFYASVTEQSGDVQALDGKHVTVIDHPVVRIIVLDSLLYVDKVQGLLGKAQRQWLDGYLSEHSDKHTVLFVHHTLGDGDGDLLDSDRLFALLEPHKQVKAIFYGHSHVWSQTERQGIQLVNLPAVGYNFSDDQPVGWVDARFRKDGVDLVLHAFGGNREGDGGTTEIAWT